MMKYVKGEHVQMTADEVAELEADRQARLEKAARRLESAPVTVEEFVAAYEKKGAMPTVDEMKLLRRQPPSSEL